MSYLCNFDICEQILKYFIHFNGKKVAIYTQCPSAVQGQARIVMHAQTNRQSEKDREKGTCLPSVVPRVGVYQAK